jgi:hypothetical protein
MDQHIYREILIRYLNPSITKLYPDGDYTFQQDNDPKHTANSVKAYFTIKGREPLPWPVQSPDWNPIENLWSILNPRIQERKCKSPEELFQVIKTAWESMPVETLSNLVDSMPRRVHAVVYSKGYPTKY